MGQNMGQTDLAVISPYSLPTISSQNHPNKKKNLLKSEDLKRNFGCGGRTRTYDLRVMSPTSFQLLYSAIFTLHPLDA